MIKKYSTKRVFLTLQGILIPGKKTPESVRVFFRASWSNAVVDCTLTPYRKSVLNQLWWCFLGWGKPWLSWSPMEVVQGQSPSWTPGVFVGSTLWPYWRRVTGMGIGWQADRMIPTWLSHLWHSFTLFKEGSWWNLPGHMCFFDFSWKTSVFPVLYHHVSCFTGWNK